MVMSRRTTSSSNLRPMRRLMANRVFWGLVTAWRLAGWPTSTSPSLVKATMEGVVRSPSLFSITRGLPPSMMATHELVVPRSMPITFAMSALRQSSAKRVIPGSLLWGSRRELSSLRGGLAGDDHPGRTQQPAVQLVARLHHPEHRARLGRGGLLGHRVLVPMAPRSLRRFGARLARPLEADQLRCRLWRPRGRLARGALPIASGLVGSHLAKTSGKSPCRPAPAVRAAHPGGGDQRLEFKAAPSSLAVISTMGMTRS